MLLFLKINKIFYSIVIVLLLLSVLLIATDPVYLYLFWGAWIIIILSIFYAFIINYDVSVFLLSLAFFPILYTNTEFHYYLNFIIIQDIPLFLLIVVFIISWLNKSLSKLYLGVIKKITLILFVYIVFSFIVAIINGNKLIYIIDEFYHFMYFVYFVIIYKTIKNRNQYFFLINFLFLLGVLFSLEYVAVNISTHDRFVTFHQNLYPLFVSLLFSLLLFSKTKKNIWIIISLLIMLLGTYLVLTRALWVAVFLTVIILLYLKTKKKWNLFHYILLSVFLILPFLYLTDNISKTTVQTKEQINKVDYRVASISNPLKDASFLMRLEIGYYIYEKFIQSPIWGKGLGDTVKYKAFLNEASRNQSVNYPDNTYLFILWKGGILGFIIFGVFLVRILKDSFFVYKYSGNDRAKALAIGFFVGILGMLFASLMASTLIKYAKINLIFAFFVAYIEFEKETIIQQKNQRY